MNSAKAQRRALFGVRRVAAGLRLRREAAGVSSRLAAAVIVGVLVVTAACLAPFVRCHLQAVAVLDLVANKPVPALLRKLVAEPVETRDFMLPTSQGAVRARMYTPVGHANPPGLVVLHGVHHLGMDEPRLIAFASAMASCGLRVLTPELPGIKDYHVGAGSIATIGDAAKWMAEQSRPPRDSFQLATPAAFAPVGVMGLSFSGGLSLMAAANPEYQPYIKFVVAVGSQDEMSRVAAYYRTGEDVRPEGAAEVLAPHEYGALVMEYENVGDFVPAGDVEALRAVLRAHLYEDVAAEKAAMAALNVRQAGEAKQLMDTTSDVTRDLLAKAEAKHVEEMAGVSPHGHLGGMTTPVYLLHGEGDNIIPSAETMWMAAELPSQTLQEELISPVISHLDMDGHSPGGLDEWRLVHFFALVLRAAENR